MFPLWLHPPSAILLVFGFDALLRLASGKTPVRLTADLAVPIVTFFSSMLLARIFDELKDLESDRVEFPDRPLPSGRVHLSDLRFLAAVCIIVSLALNFHRGQAALAYLAFLVFLLLSSRWFFAKSLVSRNLLLVFLTHQPLVPLLFLYLYFVEVGRLGLAASPETAGLLIGCYWPLLFSWEVARKIRAPESETDYRSYSLVLGPRGAATLLGIVLLLPLVFLALLTPLPAWLLPAAAASALVPLAAVIRYAVNPAKKTATLRLPVELNLLLFQLLALGFALWQW